MKAIAKALCLLATCAAAQACAEERQPPIADPNAPRPDLGKVESQALAAALRDPEALWRFITAPGTPYTERRAAALQGRKVFPAKWLPRLMAAIGQLREEERTSHWGLEENPHSSVLRIEDRGRLLRDMLPDQRRRRILGHDWQVPTKTSPYPLTWAEEARAPWPRQVQQTLRDLLVWAAPASEDEAKAWLSAAMEMPRATDREACLFVEATRASTHHKSFPVMACWRRLALDPKFPQAAAMVASSIGEATRLWDDPQSQPIGQVIITDALKLSPHKEARQRAAYSIPSLRHRFRRGGTEVRLPIPATTVVAASRMALDPVNVDAWTRLYVYAFSVCEALDEPPLKVDRRMDPQSREVREALGKFAAWFRQSRGELEAAVAQEARDLENLRAELSKGGNDAK